MPHRATGGWSALPQIAQEPVGDRSTSRAEDSPGRLTRNPVVVAVSFRKRRGARVADGPKDQRGGLPLEQLVAHEGSQEVVVLEVERNGVGVARQALDHRAFRVRGGTAQLHRSAGDVQRRLRGEQLR